MRFKHIHTIYRNAALYTIIDKTCHKKISKDLKHFPIGITSLLKYLTNRNLTAIANYKGQYKEFAKIKGC